MTNRILDRFRRPDKKSFKSGPGTESNQYSKKAVKKYKAVKTGKRVLGVAAAGAATVGAARLVSKIRSNKSE